MSVVSVRLPESLDEQARELAEQEGVSINQLITTALAEKIAALMTADYLRDRASHGQREKFERALRKAKKRAPESGDEWR